MRNYIYHFIILSAVYLISPALFAAVIIDGSRSSYPISGHIEYFEEKDLSLTLDDLLTGQYTDSFIPVANSSPNFGIGKIDSAVWFSVLVDNQLNEKKRLLVELDNPYLDHLEFYSIDADGNYRKFITGDNYPFNQRPIKTHNFVFEIFLPKEKLTRFYFRINTTTSFHIPLTLWEPEKYIEKSIRQSYGFGVFYGIMLITIFFNLFVYLSVRDISYLYYIIYICMTILVNSTTNGLAYQYLWPGSPVLANMGLSLSFNIGCLIGILFARSFLQTKGYSLTIDGVLKGLAAISVVVTVANLMLDRGTAIMSTMSLGVVVSIAIFVAALIGVIKRQRRAYFFFIAWLSLCLGTILRSLVPFDLVPINFFTLYSAQIGTAIEVLILSLAIADRINTEKVEKLNAIKTALLASEDQRLTEQKLVYQSLHDSLTGCPNRAFCHQYLQGYSNDNLTVVGMQLNSFHDINYTLGHDTGDQVLVNLISALNTEVATLPNIIPLEIVKGKSIFVAKIEGVSLALFFNVSNFEGSESIVERLVAFLQKPLKFDDMSLDIGGHIGIAASLQQGMVDEMLLRKAMVAVKEAKKDKRPSLVYNEQIDRYSAERLSLMGELKNAIDCDELELRFHPKIDLKSMQVISMEALLRWNHPQQGLLGPDKFIYLAEGTDIINPLTRWVIKNAVAYCHELKQQGVNLSVAVNITARNLLEEGFCEQIQGILNHYQYNSNDLILEVVESSVIEDHEQTIETLTQLKSLGLRLSIDDFGTGYSSLSYLKNLPVHELKIDRSFISDILSNKDDRLIVETTLAIAQQLSLTVVAEGIEDKLTMELLAQMGCEVAQGFYISKPLSSAQFTAWINESQWYLKPA